MADAPLPIALVGFGKIARDEHLGAIASSEHFRLVATVDPQATHPGLPGFATLGELIDAGIAQAVAICTPPVARHATAQAAIAAGLHVLLEKPPAATLGETAFMTAQAKAAPVTLFAAWHAREAIGVAPARDWLAGRTVTAVDVAWLEDIRRWHPGQEWMLGPGGFGVFDPGINALSILTHLCPDPLVVRAASILVPEGRSAPIAATLALASGGVPVSVQFDCLHEGEQRWDIRIETTSGSMCLARGGSQLTIDGSATIGAGDAGHDKLNAEYAKLYARFAELISRGESELDVSPLRIVADALLVAERLSAAPFAF